MRNVNKVEEVPKDAEDGGLFINYEECK